MSVSPATPKGRQRRDALLTALGTLLRERPLSEIDVRELTERAGVSRSAFYVYFPSKEAAVEALLWDIYDEMVVAVRPFLEGGKPPRATLERGIGDVATQWRRHEHLLAAMRLAATTDPAAAATWEAWRAEWIEITARTIELERRAGAAPDGPPAEDLAAVLIGMNIDAFSRPGPPPLSAMVTVWVNAIYGGA